MLTSDARYMLRSVFAVILLTLSAGMALAGEPPRDQSTTGGDLDTAAQSSTSDTTTPAGLGTLNLEIPDTDQDCRPSPYTVTLFKPCEGEDKARLWRHTKIIFAGGFGVMGVILLLPEDISKWDKSEVGKGKLLKKWWNNVTAGPVWDNDVWYINYIGHPYFGSVYYQGPRRSGYNQWNSMVYAALMSTFYWEYGLEAFAEIPSIQDLVVTPLGGWIYGEWAFQKRKEILANGGLAMGSRFWGNVAVFLLDPVAKIEDWIGNKNVEVTSLNLVHRPASYFGNDAISNKRNWELQLSLQF